jgi:pimeloyl-ACP methyl ester carboxylesterase
MRNWKNRLVKTPFAEIALTDTGGTCAPLVFLHGSGSSKQVFARQLSEQALADRRIVTVDLPGHGDSSNAFDKAAYSFTGIAATVIAALNQIGIESPVIAGWSLGGHVAIEMAASGWKTDGLILFGTPPLPHGPFGFLRGFQPKFDMLLTAKAHFNEQEASRFASLTLGDNVDEASLAAIRRADGASRVQVAHAMFRGEGCDQRRFVESTDIPVAILNGSKDPFLRLHYFDDLHIRSLWRGRCHIVDNAGHACFLDQPQAFTALISAFLADVGTASLPARHANHEIAA